MTADPVATPLFAPPPVDATLWHGDSRELLARVPDHSVDLICTDPPYNLGGYSTGNIKMAWRSEFNNDVAAWDRVRGVDLDGVFYGLRYQLPAIVEAGGGAVVNMSSVLGTVGLAQNAAYVASKHALVGLTRSSAAHAAQEGWDIRINSLHPGPTDTAMFRRQVEAQPGLLDAFKTMSPRGRLARPEEVAGLALHLASDDSAFSTGGQFVVDGGLSSTHPSM